MRKNDLVRGLALALAVSAIPLAAVGEASESRLNLRAPANVRIIFKRIGGHTVSVGGLNITQMLNTAFFFSDDGSVIFDAYTNKGNTLFKNQQALVYSGKRLSRNAIAYGGGSYSAGHPDAGFMGDSADTTILGVNTRGDVLSLVSTVPPGPTKTYYGSFVLNGASVFDQEAPGQASSGNIKVVNYSRDQAGFTSSGQYVIPVIGNRTDTGEQIYKLRIINGKIRENDTTPIADLYSTQISVARGDSTGINGPILMQKIFGNRFEFHQKNTNLDASNFVTVIRKNHKGQFAMLLSNPGPELRTGKFSPLIVANHPDFYGDEALVVVSPAGVGHQQPPGPNNCRAYDELAYKQNWTEADKLRWAKEMTWPKHEGLEIKCFVQEHATAAAVEASHLGVPTSFVLGLSAKETGWGFGRFARQGSNFFSMHSPSRGEIQPPLIASESGKPVSRFALDGHNYIKSALSFDYLFDPSNIIYHPHTLKNGKHVEGRKFVLRRGCDDASIARDKKAFVQMLQNAGFYGIDTVTNKPSPEYAEEVVENINLLENNYGISPIIPADCH